MREDVVITDDIFTITSHFVGLLEQFDSFFVELIFVPVVLSEELVQGSFTFRREYVRDSLNGLGVVFLPRRETLEPTDRFST